MKKALLAVLIFAGVVAGCSVESQASGEQATYLETVDSYNKFTVYTLVVKDSGCKYLMTKSNSDGSMTTEQMMGANGMPICK